MQTKQIVFLFLGLALLAAGLLLRLHIQREEQASFEQDYAFVRQKEQRALAAERFARLEAERKQSQEDPDGGAGQTAGRTSDSAGKDGEDEDYLGIFGVQTNLETGEREVFLIPGRVLASFPPSETLFAAQGEADNSFFSQTPDKENPRCRLWSMALPSMKLTSYGWQGICRLARPETPDIFVLDYVPFGTRRHVFLPLAFPPDSEGRFSIDWDRHRVPPPSAPDGGSYREQADRLWAQAEGSCTGESGSQGCLSAVRTLAFLALTKAPADAEELMGRLEARFGPQTAGFVREIAGELSSELSEITLP